VRTHINSCCHTTHLDKGNTEVSALCVHLALNTIETVPDNPTEATLNCDEETQHASGCQNAEHRTAMGPSVPFHRHSWTPQPTKPRPMLPKAMRFKAAAARFIVTVCVHVDQSGSC